MVLQLSQSLESYKKTTIPKNPFNCLQVVGTATLAKTSFLWESKFLCP